MFQMVRKLKYHEQKLLRKVDFINWEADNNLHEVKVMKKFFIQKREDYTLYNKLSREIRDIVRMIKDLDPNRQHRTDMSAAFLEKMYSIGLIPTKWNLELCDKINASSFCRRRYVFNVLFSNEEAFYECILSRILRPANFSYSRIVFKSVIS